MKFNFRKIVGYIFTGFPCQFRQSRLRRPVGAGHAYTPARVGYAYTPVNEAEDGTTWRHPYGASVPDA